MLIINPELNVADRNREVKLSISSILATENINPELVSWLFNLYDDGLYIINAPNSYSRLNSVTTGYYLSLIFPFYISYIFFCLLNMEEKRFLTEFDPTITLRFPRETSDLFLRYAELCNIDLNNNSYLYSSFIKALNNYEDLKLEAKKLFGINLIDTTEENTIYQVIEHLLIDIGYDSDYVFNLIALISTDNKARGAKLLLEYYRVTPNNIQTILSQLNNWKIDETQIYRLS